MRSPRLLSRSLLVSVVITTTVALSAQSQLADADKPAQTTRVALAAQSETDGLNEQVLKFVRGIGVVFDASSVPSTWLGNKQVFTELVDILHSRTPTSGDEWRDALDTLAVVASGSPDSAHHALAWMKRFAGDLKYFASDQPLPEAPTLRLSTFAYAAKIEVPSAIGLLIERLKRDNPTFIEGIEFLKDGSQADFWRMIEWAPGPNFPSVGERNARFAAACHRAKERVIYYPALPPQPNSGSTSGGSFTP